jgi:hypothetical protein
MTYFVLEVRYLKIDTFSGVNFRGVFPGCISEVYIRVYFQGVFPGCTSGEYFRRVFPYYISGL